MQFGRRRRNPFRNRRGDALRGADVRPGDEVTVSAKGFEAGDDIMLRIAWPLTNAAISEGYADGVWGVVTSRTESSITFLAPGGYPAGTAEVKLSRRGRAMPLGRISVSDGHAACVVYALRGSQ